MPNDKITASFLNIIIIYIEINFLYKTKQIKLKKCVVFYGNRFFTILEGVNSILKDIYFA